MQFTSSRETELHNKTFVLSVIVTYRYIEHVKAVCLCAATVVHNKNNKSEPLANVLAVNQDL